MRPAKTVSSAICACGAWALIEATVCSTRSCSRSGGTDMSSWPACTMTSARLERAQVGPGDLGGDRSLPAEAGVHVAGPGNPVHEGVPAQLAGQQHGPGPGRILRPHPGGERRADDRDDGHAGPPARLKPLLTPGQRRGLARVSLVRPGRPGSGECRRTGGQGTGRPDGRLGRGDQQQDEKADCGGGCQPPEPSPDHGPVSALPQAVSNSRVTGPVGAPVVYQTETWHGRAGMPDRRYGPLPCVHSQMGKGLPWPTLSSCGSARLSC